MNPGSAHRPASAVIALIVLIWAAAAGAAAITVTLNLQGGYRNATLTACGIKHHYTLYRREQAIKVDGAVAPTPTGTMRLKLKIKQCLHGRFRTVWVGHARTGSNGTFSATLPP